MASSAQEEEEAFANAMQMALGCAFPMTMKAAVELDLFNIMATVDPVGSGLSADQIAGQLSGCTNAEAPKMVERILRLLVSHGVLSCRVGDNGESLYDLTAMSKYFVPDEDGVSLGPLMALVQDIVYLQPWAYLKDAVLKGGTPFDMAHGMHFYEYATTDRRFGQLFNTGLLHHTCVVFKKALETYRGFDQVNHLVDVGGGVGAALNMIVSKYPRIKGTNYDLPQVIQNAPSHPGVEHVAGDMFKSVPEGDAIFMKNIIHSWDDEHCVRLLKNCYKAIPDTGKVIVMEPSVPEVTDTSFAAQHTAHMDVFTMAVFSAGKERTQQDLEALAAESGFTGVRFVYSAHAFWIMEFFK